MLSKLPSTKAVISAAASAAATAMVVRSLARDFLPNELRHFLFAKLRFLLTTLSNEVTIVVDEFDGLSRNHLFHAAELYLSTVANPSATRFRVSLPEKEKKIHVSVGGNEEINDRFDGIPLKWKVFSKQTQPRYVPQHPSDYHSVMRSEVRYLELTFHRKHKDKVVNEYLPFVLEKSKAVGESKKTLKLHTLKSDSLHRPGRGPWQPVNLDHPANFETLAMDDEMKSMIVEDLERFVKRREFYRRVGKAWKRGYLLFGPPGTGKSSLIAAMANYLNFDVYDLELTDIRRNSDLRRLLIDTQNRSILVVEDIDASVDLTQRQTAAPKRPQPVNPFQQYQGSTVTLSGLLNFLDGLWSSCGDERIIIFTTNHKDKLDPALLRPGRMDVHIHMSYCTPRGFQILAANYHGITEQNPLLLKAADLISSINVTPAEVGEQLLKSDDPEIALNGLIKFLEKGVKSKNLNKNIDEVKDLIKRVKAAIKVTKASPEEMGEKIVENDEAYNALKVLIEFFEEKVGAERIEDGLGSSSASLPESGKE